MRNYNFTDDDYNHVHENVINMGGSIESAEGIAGSMRIGALQPFFIGQELLWLAKVIPDAANGDWYIYENTGTPAR